MMLLHNVIGTIINVAAYGVIIVCGLGIAAWAIGAIKNKRTEDE